MWLSAALVSLLLTTCHAGGKTNFRQPLSQPKPEESLENPSFGAEPEPIAPYSFSYVADGHDGRSAREEVSDGSGTVRGSYQIQGADGVNRIVHYIADSNGFRASVQTNEPGTESKSPANALFESSQPTAEELALRYGSGPTLAQKSAESFVDTFTSQEKLPANLEQKFEQQQGSFFTNFGSFPVLQPVLVAQHPSGQAFASAHKVEQPVFATRQKALASPPLTDTFANKNSFGFRTAITHTAQQQGVPLTNFKAPSKTAPARKQQWIQLQGKTNVHRQSVKGVLHQTTQAPPVKGVLHTQAPPSKGRHFIRVKTPVRVPPIPAPPAPKAPIWEHSTAAPVHTTARFIFSQQQEEHHEEQQVTSAPEDENQQEQHQNQEEDNQQQEEQLQQQLF